MGAGNDAPHSMVHHGKLLLLALLLTLACNDGGSEMGDPDTGSGPGGTSRPAETDETPTATGETPMATGETPTMTSDGSTAADPTETTHGGSTTDAPTTGGETGGERPSACVTAARTSSRPTSAVSTSSAVTAAGIEPSPCPARRSRLADVTCVGLSGHDVVDRTLTAMPMGPRVAAVARVRIVSDTDRLERRRRMERRPAGPGRVDMVLGAQTNRVPRGSCLLRSDLPSRRRGAGGISCAP